MEKWMEINGRKLLARTLITELDWSFKGIVPRGTGYKDIYMDACRRQLKLYITRCVKNRPDR